ncbi:MAG: antiterminator Q family protein [Gammaproteobacteria bacterium]|nr:antiterminator Q family protein [Gammaproteobacteria bacterium]
MPIINENPMDAYLEHRLQEWAEWLKTGNFLNIGYQRQSSIAMFHEGKTINQTGKSKASVETHEEAEEFERMVVQMAQYKPIMADCLRNYYLNQLSLRESAKKFGISHAQYGAYLQMAKQWLVGRFYITN